MRYCMCCGVKMGEGGGTCAAYGLLGGPHRFVTGSAEDACMFCNKSPGKANRNGCPNRGLLGGCHDFVKSKRVK